MGDQGRWFKLWVSSPDDPDLDNLPIEGYGRWAKFGAYLKEHGTNGVVSLSPPCRILQAKFQVESFEAVMTCIRQFPNCAVAPATNPGVSFTIEWKNWQKYQGDHSTDRVRAWRHQNRTNETPKKRGEENKKRVTPPPTESPATGIEFSVPKSILEALAKSPRLGAVPALLTPAFWRAEVRANEGVDFGAEVLKAEAWLTANPSRAPRKELARFLHTWLGRAQREEG